MKTRGLVLALFLVSAFAANAQDVQITVKPLSDSDIQLIRQDIQDAKDDVIKNTMEFSQTEETAFWPVYKEYAAEQHKLAQKRFAIIMEYARTIDTMTDANASNLTQRMMQVEDEALALRKGYFPKFEAALGAKRAAKFYQVDNRLTMIQNVQIASQVPLLP